MGQEGAGLGMISCLIPPQKCLLRLMSIKLFCRCKAASQLSEAEYALFACSIRFLGHLFSRRRSRESRPLPLSSQATEAAADNQPHVVVHQPTPRTDGSS